MIYYIPSGLSSPLTLPHYHLSETFLLLPPLLTQLQPHWSCSLPSTPRRPPIWPLHSFPISRMPSTGCHRTYLGISFRCLHSEDLLNLFKTKKHLISYCCCQHCLGPLFCFIFSYSTKCPPRWGQRFHCVYCCVSSSLGLYLTSSTY